MIYTSIRKFWYSNNVRKINIPSEETVYLGVISRTTIASDFWSKKSKSGIRKVKNQSSNAKTAILYLVKKSFIDKNLYCYILELKISLLTVVDLLRILVLKQ